MAGKSIPIELRFWNKVKKTSKCWIWTGACFKGNRGHINTSQINYVPGKNCLAYRVAWELTYGPIPDGLKVLHKCDNGNCVRPSHLFLGTCSDNLKDCIKKGRYIPRRNHGKRRPKVMLTAYQIKEAKDDYKRNKRLGYISFLARKYGVDQSTMSRILREIFRSHPSKRYD